MVDACFFSRSRHVIYLQTIDNLDSSEPVFCGSRPTWQSKIVQPGFLDFLALGKIRLRLCCISNIVNHIAFCIGIRNIELQ